MKHGASAEGAPTSVASRLRLFAVFAALFLVTVAGLPKPVRAGEPPVRISDLMSGSRVIGRHMAVLDDPTGKLDIDAVRSAEVGAKFMPLTVDRPNFGYHKSPCWFRFTIDPGSSAAELRLDVAMPSLDTVELHIPLGDGRYAKMVAGDQLPWAARPVLHRNHVFPLKIAAGTPQTFYLRVQSASVLTIPATLWTTEAFAVNERDAQILFGLFYGLIAGLFVYNFIVWASLRDPLYLIYVAYVGAFGLALFTFDGLGYEYLWPDNVWWANHALATLMSMGLGFGIFFARGFLDTRRLAPRVDITLLAVVTLSFILAACAATGWLLDYGQVLKLLSGLAGVASVVTLTIAVKMFIGG